MTRAPRPEIFRPVVVMPTYNNARTLAAILMRVAEQGLAVMVVNDGCTDDTPAVLEGWLAARPEVCVRVLIHPHNRGKASALRTGFAAAGEAGYTHAVTIDTDGQHDPADIPRLLDAARRDPLAYVLGYRDDNRPDYPARSRIGRRISNFFIHVESGLHVRDSQCGLRVYPLKLIRTVQCRAGHFGYEAEMITRAAWAGCPVAQVPVTTRYLPIGERVSHFRPWLDTVRGIGTHARLIGRAMIPWPHPHYDERKDNRRQAPLWRQLWQWMDPVSLWRELRGGELERIDVAAALAVGAFIGNLPIYGLQTVLGLYAARRLHLHPLAVLAGTHVSIPPLAPLLITSAIGLGHLVLHGTWPAYSIGQLLHGGWRAAAGPLLLDWAVGGVLMGVLVGGAVFLASFLLLRCVEVRDAEETQTPEELPAPVSSWSQPAEPAVRSAK